jgi:hypothetical protein
MFQNIKGKSVGANVALAAAGIVCAALMGTSSSASASILAPGTTVTPTSLPLLPAGDTLVPGATMTNSFTGLDALLNIRFTGTLTSSVYSDPTTGGLDFLYQVVNNSSSNDAIEDLSLSSFQGFTTDADFVTGGVDPTTATRSGNGKNVDFAFSTQEITPGSTSSSLLVETSSLNFMKGSGAVSDGGTGGAVVEAPSVGMLMTSVPEPASFSAIIIAGGMLLGRRRR